MRIIKKQVGIFFLLLLTTSLFAIEDNTGYQVKGFDVEVGNGFYVNTYVVYNPETKDAVIVDPGKQDKQIEDFIKEHKLHVQKILNTHGHGDHRGANRYYANLYKVGVLAHENDKRYYKEDIKNSISMVFIAENQPLEIPGFEIKVLHTPGHSGGSACFYLGNILLSGDTLFEEGIGNTPGRTEEEDEKYTSQELNSIEAKLFVLPENTQVYPGHGNYTTIGYEKKNNPFFIH